MARETQKRGLTVSVLVIAKFQGDTEVFRQSLADRGDEFAKYAESAQSAGAIHHRFGIGDGVVAVHSAANGSSD